MVSKLDVSPSASHISAIAYSNDPEVVYRFNNRQGTDDVNSAFDGMRWQRGFTYTDKALLLADSDLFQTANGMRASVPKVKSEDSCYQEKDFQSHKMYSLIFGQSSHYFYIILASRTGQILLF